jgi:hypothetical protein
MAKQIEVAGRAGRAWIGSVAVVVTVEVAGNALWWPDVLVALSPSRARLVFLRAGLNCRAT